MIATILCAMAPFCGKFALYLVNILFKKEEDRVAVRKAILKSLHDYNESAVDSANLHTEYEELIKKYIESRKEAEAQK